MRSLLSGLLLLSAAAGSAEESVVGGRMICEVSASRIVAAGTDRPPESLGIRRGFAPGSTLIFDYTLDAAEGLTIYLGGPDRQDVLVEELFPASSYDGISRITRMAEFRASYSEASFGQDRINYKGSDQIFLRRCSVKDWQGHFIRTHVSGLFTRVVSVYCRPQVDAVDEVFTGLAGLD